MYLFFFYCRLLLHSVDGNENRFLREFVACAPHHSAGCRLARWLQPESVVEPDSCELSLSAAEVRCGWPAKFTVRTRDQYGNLVQSAGLKVVIIDGSAVFITDAWAIEFFRLCRSRQKKRIRLNFFGGKKYV